MFELTATICALLAACLLLGAATRRHWRALTEGRETIRRGAAAFGWLLLAVSVISFGSHFGWEVGLAWFILWSALAAILATVWLSLRPQSAVWGSVVLCLAALVVQVI